MQPDWFETNQTPEQIEQALSWNHGTFTGPGFYLTNTDTVLITTGGDRYRYSWTTEQPDGTLYDIVWNNHFNNTIFASTVPTRMDERS